MVNPTNALKATRTRRTENPRTILAFYATIIGLLLAACVAAATAILATGRALELLPFVFGFGALCLVLIVGGVFWISVKDPSKLMLGRITGEEYMEIQRVTLGDSSAGERVSTLVASDVHSLTVLSAQETDAEEDKS